MRELRCKIEKETIQFSWKNSECEDEVNRMINIKARHKNFARSSSWEWASRKNTYVAYNRYDTSQKRSFISTFASRSYAGARIETPCGARGLKHNKA